MCYGETIKEGVKEITCFSIIPGVTEKYPVLQNKNSLHKSEFFNSMKNYCREKFLKNKHMTKTLKKLQLYMKIGKLIQKISAE